MRDDTVRPVVVLLVVGIIAGWLAPWTVGAGERLALVLSVVVGSFVGGCLFSALKINLPIRNTWLSEIVMATVGVVSVVLVAPLIAG